VSPSDWALNEAGAFQFSSSVQSSAPCCNTVYGRLYPVTKDWEHRPTAVLLHGWNAEVCYQRMFPRLAVRLNRAGINAAMFELPYHMRRRPRSGPVTDFISADLVAMVEAARQSVADTRSIMAWLRDQGAKSVGVWGFSLGAWIAGIVLVKRFIPNDELMPGDEWQTR